jgi:hypothetical protein
MDLDVLPRSKNTAPVSMLIGLWLLYNAKKLFQPYSCHIEVTVQSLPRYN